MFYVVAVDFLVLKVAAMYLNDWKDGDSGG